jgi:hypothetical protein
VRLFWLFLGKEKAKPIETPADGTFGSDRWSAKFGKTSRFFWSGMDKIFDGAV